MVETKNSMFSDRRNGTDRRQQNLPMPAGLDRRCKNSRRSRKFQSKPWWLTIDYSVELVSEIITNDMEAPTSQDLLPEIPPSSNSQ